MRDEEKEGSKNEGKRKGKGLKILEIKTRKNVKRWRNVNEGYKNEGIREEEIWKMKEIKKREKAKKWKI